jgi:hypothetical protein
MISSTPQTSRGHMPLATEWQPWTDPPIAQSDIDAFYTEATDKKTAEALYLVLHGIGRMTLEFLHGRDPLPDGEGRVATIFIGPFALPPRRQPRPFLNKIAKRIHSGIINWHFMVPRLWDMPREKPLPLTVLGNTIAPPSSVAEAPYTGERLKAIRPEIQGRAPAGLGLAAVSEHGISVGFGDPFDGRLFMVPFNYVDLPPEPQEMLLGGGYAAIITPPLKGGFL